MAMWGIGLGGLAKGFEHGVGLGEKMNKMNRERQKDEAWDTATTKGKADFDKAVAEGKEKADDVPASIRYMMPHVAQAAVQSRDLDKFKFASDWMHNNEAKAGARLFESGLRRMTLGDFEGGWSDLQKLGKHPGYGGEFIIGPLQKTADGQYTTTVTTADGRRTFNPTFADPARFMAQYGNPLVALEDSRRLALERKTNAQAPGLGQADPNRSPGGPAPTSPQTQPGTAQVPQPWAAAASTAPAAAAAPAQQQQPSFTERWFGDGSPAPQLPQGAIDKLRAKPQLAPDFDQKYGAGAAARVLGGK